LDDEEDAIGEVCCAVDAVAPDGSCGVIEVAQRLLREGLAGVDALAVPQDRVLGDSGVGLEVGTN
jgi:hypothetical protein